MRVTCIIPSTCTGMVLTYLRKCLDSLRKSSELSKVELRVLVVADSSSVKNPFRSKIDLFLYSGEKPGFAQMNNIGIDEALKTFSPDYILLINDDARVDESFFSVFLKTISDTKGDIIVPLVFDYKGKKIDSFGAEYFSSGFARNSVKINTPTTIAPANCVFYKASLLKRIKKTFGFYFNPILKFYFEDVELSVRASSLGANIIKVQDLIAYHFGSLTSIKKSYFRTFYSYRNVIWLIIIGWPWRVIFKNIVKIKLVQGFAALKGTWHFGPGLYLKAIWLTLLNFKTLLSIRKTTLNGYDDDFEFESILNRHMYRTLKGFYV